MKQIFTIITLIIGLNQANAQWYQVNTNTTENLYDIFFVDSLEGYCVGGSDDWGTPQSTGVILKTTDGGENWNTIFSTDSLTIKNIAVLDVFGNKKLYAFGLKNGASYLVTTVLTTTFQNWSVIQLSYLPFEIKNYDNAIYFFDQLNGGLRKMENGEITNNLLNTYDIVLFDVSQKGVLYFNNSMDSVFVDNLNGIITNLPQHPINIIGSNQVTDASIMQSGDTIILKGTYPSAVVHSLNNGIDWYYSHGGGEGKSLILETGHIISLHLNSNKILTTNNFGQNWNEDTINGVVFLDIGYSEHNNSAFALGKNGIIYKNSFLTTVGINETELKKKINIYPNPSNSHITIDYILTNKTNGEMKIYDAMGKLIVQHILESQSSGQNSITINISHLAKGLYLCNLKIGNEVFSKRIIKN